MGFGQSLFAQVKFTDVPADHWAAKSVYDLVNMGVTEGYPDGTFRGKKNITRYETAIFLSKLSEKLGGTDMVKLKSDLSDIKDELVKIKELGNPPISGDYEMFAKTASVLAQGGSNGRGPILNYRLRTSINQDLKQGNSLKVNIDTMDSGFGGTTRELTSQMIDIKGTFKINPVDIGLYDFGAPIDLSLTMGPGPIQHFDSTGLLPMEDGYVFDRPYSGVDLSTQVFAAKVSGGYQQIAKTISGVSTTSLLTGALKFDSLQIGKIQSVDFAFEGDYYAEHPTSSGERDLRSKINCDVTFSPQVAFKTVIGMGSSASSGMMVKSDLWFLNPWNTNTTFMLGVSKIGSQFITSGFEDEEFNIAGYDLFMRPLQNATDNVDLQLIQNITDKLTFTGKGSMRLSSGFVYDKSEPMAKATAQVGLSYEVVQSAILNMYYRIQQVPSKTETADMFAMGLLYKF